MRTNKRTFTEEARRRQLVDAAIEVMAAEGYGAGSFARIAKEAGVAKSAVLYYFGGKDDLVAAIVERVMGDAAAEFAPAVLAETTALGRLTAYIRANCAYLDGHRTASVAMFEISTGHRTAEGLRFDQAVQQAAEQEPPDETYAVLDPQRIIEQGVEAGELAPVDPTFTKNALRACLDGAVSELARDPDYDVVGYGEQLIALFATALTPVGRKDA